MTIIQIMFYVSSAIAIFSGLMVVGSSNPVRGALFLVLAFFSMASLWLLLQAEFLALILVLVYVGAVMTLFLFVVMMLSVSRLKMKEGFVWYLPYAGLIVLLLVALICMVVGPHQFGLLQAVPPVLKPADYSNTAALGMQLYTHYVYPFEVAAVLLLTAIVAAITLTHRVSPKRKAQIPSQQVAVTSKDRLRIVKFPPLKKDPNL
jgi:NADH-quinone oxidoreductase subunit J